MIILLLLLLLVVVVVAVVVILINGVVWFLLLPILNVYGRKNQILFLHVFMSLMSEKMRVQIWKQLLLS